MPDQHRGTEPGLSSRRADPRIWLVVAGGFVLIGLIWFALGRHKQTPIYQAMPANTQPGGGIRESPSPSPVPAATEQAGAAGRSDISLTRLTTQASRDVAPVWTAEGTILFQSNRNNGRTNGADIWEIRPDGSEQREIVRVVVSTPQEWGDPGLGAGIEMLGGKDIAVYEAQHFHEIMRVAVSRASAFPIVRTAQDGADSYFSQLLEIPGGQSASNIVYSEATGMAAWVANISGQGIQIRTASLAAMAGQPSSTYGAQLLSLGPAASVQGISYSPDGNRLVAAICSQNCGNGRGPDLLVLDSRSGQVLQQLTNTGPNGANNSSPRWSPRGDLIAFAETGGAAQSIWVVSAAGDTTPRRIDTGGMASYGPSWSKDGSSIAFVGVTGGNHDIWLARSVVDAPRAESAGRTSAPIPPLASSSEVRPSFDCAKATTPTEKLICRDSALAAMESNMSAAYSRAVRELPVDQSSAFRRDHLQWFKSFARACNALTDDAQRRTCAAGYLSSHTQQIEVQLRR